MNRFESTENTTGTGMGEARTDGSVCSHDGSVGSRDGSVDGATRREFVQRAAKTAAYVAPVVMTLAASRSAFASGSVPS